MSPIRVLDKMSRQQARTRTEFILLTSKLYDSEDVCDNPKLDHEELLQKLHTKAEMSTERIDTERDCALIHNHGVLQSILRIVMVGDECNAGHTDTLTHLQMFFEEARKVKAVPSSTGLSQE